MDHTADSYWIGELAERSGMSPDTIRYYERAGVLPEPDRSPAGYRVYGDGDLERLRFIHRAKALGLTLEEIGEIRELAEAGIEPCDHVRARLRERLAQVEESVRELALLRDRLKGALSRAEKASSRGSVVAGPSRGPTDRRSTSRAGTAGKRDDR